MGFLEELDQICPGLSSDHSSELREFLAASHEVDQDLLDSSTLQEWFEQAGDQGYDSDTLQQTLRQIASTVLSARQQERFLADWSSSLSSNRTVAEFIAALLLNYPELKLILTKLTIAAEEEHKALSAQAGGTGKDSGFTKTWKTPGTRTTKQKSEAFGADALEVAAGVLFLGGVGKLGHLALQGRQKAEVPDNGEWKGIVTIRRHGQDDVEIDTRTHEEVSDIDPADLTDEDVFSDLGNADFRKLDRRFAQSDLSNLMARPRADTDPFDPERQMRFSLDMDVHPAPELADIAQNGVDKVLDDVASDITNDVRAEINVEEGIESDLD